MKPQDPLLAERSEQERRGRAGATRTPWRREVYVASAIALFIVLQIWAITVVLSTVHLEGTPRLAFLLAVSGAVIAVGNSLRYVVRLSRRRG